MYKKNNYTMILCPPFIYIYIYWVHQICLKWIHILTSIILRLILLDIITNNFFSKFDLLVSRNKHASPNLHYQKTQDMDLLIQQFSMARSSVFSFQQIYSFFGPKRWEFFVHLLYVGQKNLSYWKILQIFFLNNLKFKKEKEREKKGGKT